MPTDESFLAAVAAAPADHLPRLVYADWLDERADRRGEYLRLSCELATRPRRPTTKRKTCEARFAKIRTGIDPAWRTAVAVAFDDDAWRKVLTPLDKVLQRVGWNLQVVRDKLGEVFQKSEAALLRLLVAYEFATPTVRAEVRALVPEFRTFFAATFPPAAATPAATVRRQFVHYALLDQYPDPRDAVLSLAEICGTNDVSLPELAAIRREIAPMASATNRYGFGSTRSHLLKGYGSGYGQRGAPNRPRG